MIIVYVPCKDIDETNRIAKALLDKKLIACANIVDSRSLYNWEGTLTEEYESILLMKTEDSKFEQIRNFILRVHSYETPCILKFDVEANSKYSDWVKKEVN